MCIQKYAYMVYAYPYRCTSICIKIAPYELTEKPYTKKCRRNTRGGGLRYGALHITIPRHRQS